MRTTDDPKFTLRPYFLGNIFEQVQKLAGACGEFEGYKYQKLLFQIHPVFQAKYSNGDLISQ
jgi:hypothetical protein